MQVFAVQFSQDGQSIPAPFYFHNHQHCHPHHDYDDDDDHDDHDHDHPPSHHDRRHEEAACGADQPFQPTLEQFRNATSSYLHIDDHHCIHC